MSLQAFVDKRKLKGKRKMGKPTLASITGGRVIAPIKTTIMGVAGVGKSTFASGAAGAIFIPTEEGTNCLDVQRFPRPETLDDVLDDIVLLKNEKHDYKTLAVDTLDALEPIVWADVCKAGGKKSIEDFGYGKGYVEALARWRVMVSCMDSLRVAKGMNIVLIAHSQIKKFSNPDGADYDRFEMKLAGKGASALFTEWSDVVLFAQYETLTPKDEQDRTRAVSTGRRIARTVHSGAYDAKNRYNLPDPMLLDWDIYRAAVKSFFADKKEVAQ